MVLSQKVFILSFIGIGSLSLIVIGAFVLNPALFLESEDIIISNSLYLSAPRDSVLINDVSIAGPKLVINASYGGGCEAHVFQLIASDQWMESYPVQTHVLFSHNANNDTCLAFFTKTFVYNLTLLKQRYQELYQEDSATIIMRIQGGTDNFSINYSF